MPATRAKELSIRDGFWIHRSTACKEFKLAPSDLDSLVPIQTRKNPRGGPNDIKIYNRSDVIALKERLTRQSSASLPGSELVKRNGPEILRTTAMKTYKLKSAQMDRLKPVSISPNPHNSGTMRHYNLCDVTELAESIKAGKANPQRNAALFENY